mmetsp:Transcript_13415/g.30813  ORF Transcript_13415/g.30813 Transcript_13415/m.30813 type:complete len:276 (+) Transcript_13415:601-1428(+)
MRRHAALQGVEQIGAAGFMLRAHGAQEPFVPQGGSHAEPLFRVVFRQRTNQRAPAGAQVGQRQDDGLRPICRPRLRLRLLRAVAEAKAAAIACCICIDKKRLGGEGTGQHEAQQPPQLVRVNEGDVLDWYPDDGQPGLRLVELVRVDKQDLLRRVVLRADGRHLQKADSPSARFVWRQRAARCLVARCRALRRNLTFSAQLCAMILKGLFEHDLSSKAKVEQLHMASGEIAFEQVGKLLSQHHVFGLDVAVDDVERVQVFDRDAKLLEDVPRVRL